MEQNIESLKALEQEGTLGSQTSVLGCKTQHQNQCVLIIISLGTAGISSSRFSITESPYTLPGLRKRTSSGEHQQWHWEGIVSGCQDWQVQQQNPSRECKRWWWGLLEHPPRWVGRRVGCKEFLSYSSPHPWAQVPTRLPIS